MTKIWRFRPEAEREIDEAIDRYEGEQEGSGRISCELDLSDGSSLEISLRREDRDVEEAAVYIDNATKDGVVASSKG